MGGRGASYAKTRMFDYLDKEGAGKGSVNSINIANYAGQSLEQIESRLRALNHEELFAFDKNGKIIAGYKGDKESVSFPKSLLETKDIVVTHGHPKGASDFGGTFSFADMRNMLRSNWSEHRATASGQGEMNYILRRTAKANPSGFYNQLNKDYNKLKGQMSSAWDNSFKATKKSGLSLEQRIHRARQESVGVLNAYYKKTAEKYGFEYITRKKQYKYGR